MKRFLKTLALLVVSLFIVVTGVDRALNHLSHSPNQSSFTIYNDQGKVLLAYDGDLNGCKAFTKPGPTVTPLFFHRT